MKKHIYHIEKKGKKWVGDEDNVDKVESGKKSETVERIKDKAKLNRPSEVIIHETDGTDCKEVFEDKPIDKNSKNEFLTD